VRKKRNSHGMVSGSWSSIVRYMRSQVEHTQARWRFLVVLQKWRTGTDGHSSNNKPTKKRERNEATLALLFHKRVLVVVVVVVVVAVVVVAVVLLTRSELCSQKKATSKLGTGSNQGVP
jgi:hypothetical protein